jgi:nucleoside-diphosphate-sugar epimerase
MSTFLVTGGAGFIRSNIVEALVGRGETVPVIGSLLTGKRANIEPFLGLIGFIEGDIGDGETLRMAMKGVDFVLYQPTLPSVPRSLADPLASNQPQCRGGVEGDHCLLSIFGGPDTGCDDGKERRGALGGRIYPVDVLAQ